MNITSDIMYAWAGSSAHDDSIVIILSSSFDDDWWRSASYWSIKTLQTTAWRHGDTRHQVIMVTITISADKEASCSLPTYLTSFWPSFAHFSHQQSILLLLCPLTLLWSRNSFPQFTTFNTFPPWHSDTFAMLSWPLLLAGTCKNHPEQRET